MWVLYSLFGAFFQASEMAIKKKALKTKGTNNFIAFAAFSIAALIFAGFLIFNKESLFSFTNLSSTFWAGLGTAVAVNVIATYFLYKALDLSELSYLMPYLTLTSITVIIPPIFLFKEYPSLLGFVGISIVVAGAILMEYRKAKYSEAEIIQHKQNRKGLAFFLVTAACYTVSPSVTKLAVVESSPLFATFLIYLLMGVSFGIIFIFSKESRKIKSIFQSFSQGEMKGFFVAIFLAAISIAISNMSINYAYKFQSVAYVMAIKRIMPLFAFIIGYFYFHERTAVKKKIFATFLMVLGAIIITALG